MPILETILIALAPHLIDLVIDIFTAEKKHVGPNKGYAKHDYVIGKFADRIKSDSAFNNFENRDIMDTVNIEIKKAVNKLNDDGVFKKGDKDDVTT